jgi:hypothetical protein
VLLRFISWEVATGVSEEHSAAVLIVLTCMSYRPLISYDLGHRTAHAQVRDVTPGPLTVTDTCIMYHLTNFGASRNVFFHMRYVRTCVGARVVGG